MSRRIMIHDFVTGQSYERDMTETEEAQADLDQKTFQAQEETVDDLVEGEQP